MRTKRAGRECDDAPMSCRERSRFARNAIAAVVVSLFVAGVSHAQRAADSLPQPSLQDDEANPRLMQGLTKRTIAVGGAERIYYVHKAPDLTAPAPVVIQLHGGNGTAPRRAQQTGFNTLADAEGFIAVYPQGVNYGWNDGRDTAFLQDRQANADDVGFFHAMVDDLVEKGEADPRRIYVSGGSNGGMMTFRLMCEAGDRIAAATVIVASLPEPLAATCRPTSARPMLIMNGTADPLMPFEGGVVARSIENGRVIPVMQTVEFWKIANGCSDPPTQAQAPDRDPEDGVRTDVISWSSCRDNAGLVFYRMNGAGHGLPGRSRSKSEVAERLGGKSTNDFDSTAESWAFMQRFALN